MLTMIITIAWELTSDVTGACNVPTWLDNLYSKVWSFWSFI
jgi:hypothetical protein